MQRGPLLPVALFSLSLAAILPGSFAPSYDVEKFYTKYFASGAVCILKSEACLTTCKATSYEVCSGACPWSQIEDSCYTLQKTGPNEGLVC